MNNTISNFSAGSTGTSYVEWGCVIAGTVIACAVSLILLQFGQALGLAVPERYDDSYTALKVLIIGLWLLWVQLMASMSGGYLAGRMRGRVPGAVEAESEIRDGAHGLLVWASSSLVAMFVAGVAAVLHTIALHNGVDMAQEANARAAAIPEALAERYGIIFGFGAVASSIVSAVAAYWMGTVGGDHRDDNSIDWSRFSFRVRKTVRKG